MSEADSAKDDDLFEDLAWHHRQVLDEMRPAAVAKQHALGRLTARERIARLLDEGEALWESGALAVPVGDGIDAPADGLVVGVGRVHGQHSVIVSCDYTALGGSLGITSHAKLTRAMYLAERHGCPVFVLAEGGGARAQEYQSLPSVRPAKAFGTMARLSGRVPLIGLALGRAFAGHAIMLGECDTVIATEGAAMGIAGPPLVKAATGQDLTPEQIGAAPIHAAAGAVERLDSDDEAAIAAARDYADYFVRRWIPLVGDETLAFDELREAHASKAAVDVRLVASSLADPDSLFELRPMWSPEAMTALVRVGGHTVGISAVGPAGGEEKAQLTRDSCDKLARFASLCDAFSIPRVNIVGSVEPAADHEGPGAALFRHAARLVRPAAGDGSASVTFLVGRLDGVAQILLGGFSDFLSGPFHYMWPRAAVRGLGAQDEMDAERIAQIYATDDVIDPGRTREVAIASLAFLDVPGQARDGGRYVDVW